MAKSEEVVMKGFFFQSTKKCGIVVESDSIPLEGSHLHHFAQKIGTVNLVEISSFFNKLGFSISAHHFG